MFFVIVVCAHVSANAGILAEGATLEKLADGFAFTEGPAADAEGNVYFTDQPNNRILAWSTKNELSTFMESCGRANGLCLDRQGFLWACADEKNQLWRINSRKEATAIVDTYQGKLLNGPNDVWIAPKGDVYFTDPFYKRNYWKRGSMEQDCQGVYLLAPESRNPTRVIDDMEQPNGLIGTPDGKTLYVSDITAGKTWAYTIQADGALSNKTLFCTLGSDGMTIDNEGNVYLYIAT
jgi:gluconolactonase